MSVEPYTIHIPEATVVDLRQRLGAARWTDQVAEGWGYGVDLATIRELCGRWADGYDWMAEQARLNDFDHYRAEVDGFGLHFLHARSGESAAIPLLLLHGWPSSFVQMLRILPLLTAPSAPGAASFHVVVPSLPGYGFSDRPRQPGMSVGRIATLLHELMTVELGYERYATRGTDLGAGVLQQLALGTPEALLGVHQGGTNPYVADVPDDLSDDERRFVADAQQWTSAEMAYAQLHSSKPQTVACALNDSPAGLAAWILEKFHAWSDGPFLEVFGVDELLTNLTIYWATETIGSSMRLYYETARDASANWGRVEVPTAMAMTKDMFPTPREWVERTYNVVRWTDLPRGGHFPEWDVPELVADDVRAFYA